ncbi:hypothetical protein COU60_05525 [Candidatus Pacearchaeota archaeon CG10_big_fil_rev_8_21_14_0_10_34_76]|nr:MAG: hypothetical protein COU60_05525 [Candidatus Pacearchaeota archaeon CG10_big_fil_rev_8_21_14_0_10_34_76]
MKTKKAQAWGFDLIIASVLFILGIVIFFVYTINTSQQAQDKIDELDYQGNLIAEDLMSEGSPADWNVENVQKIGILTNNKINNSKLENFYQLSDQNYQKTKSLFDIKYDYFMNLSEEISINGENIERIGRASENPTNLIKITRFTIYNNNPVTLNIYIWQE